jgi:fucose permease
MTLRCDVTRSDNLLVAISFLAFLAIGLTAGLMGVAWPSMRDTYGLGDAALGTLMLLTMVGSLAVTSIIGRLVTRFGTGTMLVIGGLVGGLGYLGVALAPSWPVLVLLATVTSMGTGAIIPSLNIYFAMHQSAGRITWLNACFGLGATVGPAILTAILSAGGSWRWGYATLVVAYVLLVAGFGATRRQWPQPLPADPDEPTGGEGETSGPPPQVQTPRAFTLPSVWLRLLLFFTFTGLEVSTGQWTYTLFTEERGIAPAVAGTWASAFWASMTVGRVLFGLVVDRMNVQFLVRACMVGAILGAAAIWVGVPPWSGLVGVILTGFCLSPLFPVLTSATAERLGAAYAADVIGYQMTAVRIGLAAFPALAGVLVEWVGVGSLGPYLFAVAAAMVALNEAVERVARG